MKGSGPAATDPVATAAAPHGRRREKSQPMPPPCCMVTAVSFSESRMLSIESRSGPATKQLKSVTRLPVPAPANMRPPGKKRKSDKMALNVACHRSGSCSARATARETRRQVSDTSASGFEFSRAWRYFDFHIHSEIGITFMAE